MQAPPRTIESAPRPFAIVVWCLRLGVALQALGVGMRRLGLMNAWEDDSPVFGLLLYEWEWQEAVAQGVDDGLGWAYFVCGVALLALPLCGTAIRKVIGRSEPLVPVWVWQVPLCVVVALVQLTVTMVAWHRGGFFMSQLAPVSEAARLAPPVVLALLSFKQSSADANSRLLELGVWLLRIAAALTFVGHGLKALFLSPKFTDMLLAAADRIHWNFTEASAHHMLRIIGAVDIVVAVLILCSRWRSVAYYMAAWAFIAALARVVHSGSGGTFEVFIRAGNYCVPLAIALCWQLSRPKDPA